MFRRFLTVFYLTTVALAAFVSINQTVYAQTEPIAIIDAAFKDLSTKLGIAISRTKPGNDTYTWEETDFGSPALGCPSPGLSYPQVMTHGYKIVITVNGTAYDYRASADGKILFQCTSAGGSAPVAITPSTATPIPAQPAGQPVTYTNPMAYIGNDGNVYVTQSNGTPGTTAITNNAKGTAMSSYPFYQTVHRYQSLRWSPDGLNLAFVESGNPGLLYVARSGQAPQILAHGIYPEFPPFWLPNGQEIAYLVPAGVGSASGGPTKFQIQAVPVGGGNPRALGDFNHQAECGGGGFDPMEALYYSDAGALGNGLVLYNTASGGYVYSLACTGVGVGFTPGTVGGWQRPDLGRAALSPDGTQLIAVRFDLSNPKAPPVVAGLEKVDLATGKSTPLPTQPGIDQVGWADNGTILYSTLTAPRAFQITVTLSPALQAAVGLIDLTAALKGYTVTLWKTPAAGGDSVQFFAGSGRGIGKIGHTADGATIAVSLIPSMESVINAANGGQSVQAVQQSFQSPDIMLVNINGQVVAPPITGRLPTIGAGSFVAVGTAPAAAVPPTVVPAAGNIPPPALVIGGQAVVSVTGDALNVRQSPSKGAQVARLIKAGVMVTVVGGPANAEGLRWWQIKLADGTTGWVADQVTDSSGTTNTLTPQ